MALNRGPTYRRRHFLLRRFLERRGLVRYPVSVARRRIGSVLLIVMVLCAAWYGYTTRDEAIRRRAVEFLEKAMPGGVEISVERASFRMFGGITLHNVNLSVPYDAKLDPNAHDAASRSIFSATTVKLIHDPWRLLIGDLSVERVVAVGPTIVLAHNADTGLRNWQLLTENMKPRRMRKPESRPIVTLRSARAKVVSIDKNGQHTSRVEELDADVRPHPQIDTGYFIEVRRYSEPVERTTVLFDPGERMVANSPFVDAQTLRLQIPKPAQALFDLISLKGEVKLSRMTYGLLEETERDTAIELRHVSCEIPLLLIGSRESAEHGNLTRENIALPDESVLRMTAVNGVIDLHGDQLKLDISGSINGARCSVKGVLDQVRAGLDNVGMDVTFRGDGIPTPEGVVRKRLFTDADVPHALRKFFVDYDPHGRFDIELRFVRSAGPEGSLRSIGVIQPRGVSGSARWFPYRLKNILGEIRYGKNEVHLDLNGYHGAGHVDITGHFDRSTTRSTINLDIKGSAIPLDNDLYEPLPKHYQAAWRRFLSHGSANIHARLHRPGSTDKDAKLHWRKTITIDLIDSVVSVAPYPIPLENVDGRLEVDADRIQIEGLTGFCDGGTVRVDGCVILSATESPQVELTVEADGIRLDESLAAALPPEERKTFEQFEPRGFVDLLGRLSLGDETQGLHWNVEAMVHDTSILYEQFPYSVDRLTGELAIRPGKLSFIGFRGRHGPTEITFDGEVARQDDGNATDVVIEAEALPLERELYDALPRSLKDVWQLVQPRGRIHVRTELHHLSRIDAKPLRHRTEIETADAEICYRHFPIPLTSVSARVLADNGHDEILSLRGRTAGGGSIELRGEIELTGPGSRGTLAIRGEGMKFDGALLDAMPTALGRFLFSMKPKGGFSIRLDPLRFETDASGRTSWTLDGEIRLDGAHFDLGFPLRDCHGTVAGSVRIAADGTVSFNGQARLAKVVLSGWHLSDLKAGIRTDAETEKILIEDVSARLYDGDAAGFAEIERRGNHSRYRASFTVRDLQLSRYLEIHKKKIGKQPGGAGPRQAARGSIAGNLVLRGKTGKGGYREGAGEVLVSDAQVWKLPIGLAIFQVLNLTPDENVFHDGRLKFFLSRDRLTFRKIDLQGKALSFIGGGTMDLKSNRLDVTLLAGSPLRVRVPLLTEILEGASREMMEIRVTGTLDKPSIRPQPLKSLTKALETLFPESPRSREERPVSAPRR